MFLVDTNVISEVRKGRRADTGVIGFWADAVRNNIPLFLSAITIGELRRGVDLIRHRGDHQQAAVLESWLEQVLQDYAIDKQIAAIALLHDLTVMSRNSDDFAGTGVKLLNPFSAP